MKAASLLLAALFLGTALYAQTPYRAPRTPDGKPDLNGIWQALNEANYDLEMHAARPALALRDGPYGPVPAAQVLALGAAGAVPPRCSASRAYARQGKRDGSGGSKLSAATARMSRRVTGLGSRRG